MANSDVNIRVIVNNADAVNKLKSVQTALNSMSGYVKQANDAFAVIPNTLKNVGKNLESTGKQMYYLGTRMFTSISLPIIGVGTAAVKMALDFDQAMSQVRAAASTTAVVSEEQYAAMKNAVLDMSMNSVKSAAEISTGFYELVSAGYSVQESIKMLPQVVEFATASAMDMGTAAQFASSQLHAWGGTGITLQEIMDKTSTAVQISQLHFDEFTKAINMAAPAGRVAGQDFDQVSAALMAMADRGAVAGRMGMNLRAALLDMGKATPEKEMEKLGLSFAYTETTADHMKGSIKPLNVVAKELGNKLSTVSSQQERLTIVQKLFASNAATAMIPIMEAATGKTGLLSEETLRAAGIWDEEAGSVKGSAKSLDEYLKILKDSAGATKRMSDAVKATPWAKIQILANNYKAVLIKMGTDILNISYPALKKLSDILWDKLGSATVTQKLEALAAALMLVVGPVMLIVLGAFVEAIGAIFTAIGALLTPVGIFGVIIAMKFLGPLFDQVKKSADSLGGGFTGLAGYVVLLAAQLGLIDQTKAWEYLKNLGIDTDKINKDQMIQDMTVNIKDWKDKLADTKAKLLELRDDVVAAAKWIEEHRKLIEGLAITYGVLGLTGKILGVVSAITGTAGLIPAMQSLAALAANPITWVIVASALTIWAIIEAVIAFKKFLDETQGYSWTIKAKFLLEGVSDTVKKLAKLGLMGPVWMTAAYALGWHEGGIVGMHGGGIPKAQTGMIIPGSSPLRDRVPVMAEQGEGIMSKKAIENLLKNGVVGGNQVTYNINFNPGVMIASPGEQRAFARQIKKLIKEDDSRYIGNLAISGVTS